MRLNTKPTKRTLSPLSHPASRRAEIHSRQILARHFRNRYIKPAPSVTIETEIEKTREIEVTFFAHTESIKSHLPLNDLPCQHIFQAYIPRRNITALLQMAPEARKLSSRDRAAVTRARLRRVIEHNPRSAIRTAVHYYLQLKSKKWLQTSRLEVSIRLSEARFRELLRFATGGALEKIRFIQAGRVRDNDGKVHRAEAHIDLILGGGPRHRLDRGARLYTLPSFAFIDIEVPRQGLCARLTDDDSHSFGFLKRAVSLLSLKGTVRKHLTTRRIASRGLSDRRFQTALRALKGLASDS